MVIPVDPDNLLCGDPEEGAATGLLALMSGLSEEHWAAGWILGNEHCLWQMVKGGDNRGMGMGSVTERQVMLLRLLHEECDGWWIWDDDQGPVFRSTEQWLATLAKATP